MTRPDLDAMESAARVALTETEGARWGHHGEHEQVCYPMGEGGVNFLGLDGPPSDTIIRWALAWQPLEALALLAYARELEATLANERGEGEPPVQGWKWADCAGWGWAWVLGGGPDEWIAVHHKPGAGWYVRLGSAFMRMHAQVAVSYDTARAAMRAASVPA